MYCVKVSCFISFISFISFFFEGFDYTVTVLLFFVFCFFLSSPPYWQGLGP
jgi:phage-related holin